MLYGHSAVAIDGNTILVFGGCKKEREKREKNSKFSHIQFHRDGCSRVHRANK